MPIQKLSRKEQEHRAAQEARKARFRAALELARMSAQQWAEANDISGSHLSYVLSGDRDSQTLIEKIERFTNEQLASERAPRSRR